jgi:hypothetical protein
MTDPYRGDWALGSDAWSPDEMDFEPWSAGELDDDPEETYPR